MKKYITVISMLLYLIILNANAVSSEAKQKYPYPLLTDDYGILNENDLAAYTWGLNPRPFTPEKISGQYTYWQCFHHEQISITLEDTGYSSEDIGWRDNFGDLKITVTINKNVAHEYTMRSKWPVSDFEKRFNLWRKLIKGQKYICLAGGFSSRGRSIENGTTKETYYWTFEKIKTQKGCDSYFDSCKPSHQEFLREQANQERWKKNRDNAMLG